MSRSCIGNSRPNSSRSQRLHTASQGLEQNAHQTITCSTVAKQRQKLKPTYDGWWHPHFVASSFSGPPKRHGVLSQWSSLYFWTGCSGFSLSYVNSLKWSQSKQNSTKERKKERKDSHAIDLWSYFQSFQMGVQLQVTFFEQVVLDAGQLGDDDTGRNQLLWSREGLAGEDLMLFLDTAYKSTMGHLSSLVLTQSWTQHTNALWVIILVWY